MAEFDPVSWVLPLVISTVVPFVLLSISKFSKTSEGTLSGTIRLEGLKGNVEEVREAMDKGFCKIEKMLEAKDREMRLEFQKSWERIETMHTKVELLSYRITELERSSGQNRNKWGSNQDALGEGDRERDRRYKESGGGDR